MIDTFSPISLVAATAVTVTFIILGYYLWKTLITSNLFQKGVTLYQQQDFAGAEVAFRQVMAKNSTNDVVRLLLGDALMQQGKIDGAKEVFQGIIARSPKNPDAYLRLSNVLMQQENKAEAKSNLQTAKDLFAAQRNPQKAKQIEQLLEKMK